MNQLLLSSLLFIAVISFGQVPNYVPTNGLVGWWGFNGNANDESGNGNNGTVNGATLTTDRFGNPNSAYDFDGVNDEITIAHTAELNSNELTISVWFFLNNNTFLNTVLNDLDGQWLISKSPTNISGGTKNRAFEIAVDNGLSNLLAEPFYFSTGSSNQAMNTQYRMYSDQVIYSNNWYHGVYVITQNNLKQYLNGVLVVDSTINDSFRLNNNDIICGNFWGDNTPTERDLDGKLDDIGIWNRALTQCEISELYHAQQFTPPALTLSDTTSACGASTTLDAGTDPAWDSYLWNTSEATQTITVDNSGIYTIAVTDTNGCIGYDTTLVSIIDPTIDQIDTNICIGDSLVLSVNSIYADCFELPQNLKSELLGYWPFCGNADDVSGNNHHGVVTGATLTNDRFGNANSAYSFNGFDVITTNIDSEVEGISQMSMSAWFSWDGLYTGGNVGKVIRKQSGTGSGDDRWQMTINNYGTQPWTNDNINFLINLSAQTDNRGYTDPAIIDSLYHIVVVYNGNGVTNSDRLKMYLNGQYINLNYNDVIPIITPTNSFPVVFGEHFAGDIDDIGMWTRTLDSNEVRQLYELGNYDITWSTGDTTSSIMVQPTTTTTYSVTVDDGISSCTDDVTITVNEVIPVLTDTLSTCGVSTTLDAGTDPAWDSYLWNTSEATQTITVDNSGIYTIAVTDTNGCVGYDTTLVSIIDPTIAQIDTNICIGDSIVLSVGENYTNCIEMPANLKSDLLGYWPFCGNADDVSGNNHHGVVTGATLTNDRFGNANSAYNFNGGSDIITTNIDSEVEGISQMSMSVWFKWDGVYGSSQVAKIIWKPNNAGIGTERWALVISSYGAAPWANDNIVFGLQDLTVNNNTYGDPIIADSLYHMVVTFDGFGSTNQERLKLYINGVLFPTTYNGTIPNLTPSNSFPVSFGEEFEGDIDDSGMWTRTLDSNEVRQLYELGNYDITWSTGDTTSSITVQPTTTTTYSVTVDDGISSCTDDVTITVNDPQVTAGADQTICNGDAITLSGAGASTYAWDNGVTDGVAISPTATADYIVTGTDTLGCMAEDTTTITVNPLPTVDAGIFQQICDGDTVTLSGTGAATYTWDNGQTDGTEFTPTTTTLYTVIGTDANGCIDSDTVSIGVWSLPLVDAGADQTICDEDLVTLSGSGASTYSWDNSVVDGVGFSPSATTTYTLTGTDANGCSDLAYVTVTVNPLPAVDAGSAQIVCTGTPVTLSATGAVSYTWNNGVTDGVAFTPTNTLLYEVIGTDANSCEATDTVTVTVVAELTVLAGTDQTVCEGTSVTLSGSGANTYTWTGGITNAIPFTASSTTIYVVTGSDGNNCADTDSVTVNVNPTPDLSSVTTNVSLGMDGEIDLSVTNGTPPYLYDWDNDGIGDFDDPEDLSTLEAGTYSVIVTDDFGCSDTLIAIITEDLQIFISTVITPNGDGMNDTWGVNGINADAKVQVLNRWGQVLYNTTGYSIPWDGTNNGETLPASDYYYIIDLGQGDVRTGTITLKY